VLAEQLRQRYEGIMDEEKLRHVSIQFSRFSEQVGRKIASIVEYDEKLCPDETTTLPDQGIQRRLSRSDEKRSLGPKKKNETNESKACQSLHKIMKRLSLSKN